MSLNHSLESAPPPDSPKVLLADTNRWTLSARLAIALTQAGCSVSAVCATPGHALLKTRAVKAVFHYSGFRPLESLTAAIAAVEPDVVIPCCDRSVRHLHELHGKPPTGSALAELIERSLGSPASYPVVASRYQLLELAREEGVRVPRTERIQHPGQLAFRQNAESFPCVLKADGTWGGGGIRIVHHADEMSPALGQLAQTFRLRRALKRLVVNRDSFWLRPWWNQRAHEVITQSYIHGHPANCAVICWKGRVLAGIAVEVVNSEGATGPASIVRVVENTEMMFAAERIAGRLGLSGLFGLDFMIEEGSKAAYLIEMNPRSTPLCHLRLDSRRDMAGALWAQLTGQPLPDLPPSIVKDLIAYFPQACNLPSALLASSYLDIPEGEPELVRELRRPWLERTPLFRFFTWLSQRPSDARSSTSSPEGRGQDESGSIHCPCYGLTENEQAVNSEAVGRPRA
jgi:hypothetical protein